MKAPARTTATLALLAFAPFSVAAQVVTPQGPNVGAIPPISDSVISLPNLVGKTSATACIVGNSTATPGPSPTNGVDPSQMVWGFLTEKLKHDQPGITWTFSNFGIGATNENQFNSTGNAIGVSLPSWFTDPNQTWASYVHAANCDVLFWMYGTNAANSGNPNGNSAATFIRQGFETINGWSKVPKLVLVTNKQANPANDTSGDDPNQAFHKTQAAFHRTFALSNAAGYTSFANITALGIGLVDLGRYFTARIDGHDPAAQYFQSKPSCLANNLAIGAIVSEVNVQTSTTCTTTHGDYRLTIVLPGEGGTTLFSFGGSNAIKISAGILAGDYIRLNIGGGGNIVPKYVLDGNIAGAPTQTGSSVATTNGQDVTVTVALSADRVQVTINGTLALDVDAPRFIGEQSGGTPINIGFASTPTGSPTMNITEFYEGIGYGSTPFSSYNIAMGPPLNCTAATQNCQGGNANNHQRSNSAALDREVINALRFAVPAAASSTKFGEVQVDGTTISSASGVISGSSPFHPGYASGQYYTTPFSALTTLAVTANRLYSTPFYVSNAKTFTKASIDITSLVSGHCELGIYNNSSGTPGSRLYDLGNVSSGSNGQAELTGLTIALSPSWYWLVVGCDSTPTLESGATTNGLSSFLLGMAAGTSPSTQMFVSWTYSTGNLPDPFGTPSYSGNTAQPLVYLRF